MFGAIIGDIVGSIYEGRHSRIKTKEFPLFSNRCHFTDDTVLTFAVYEAMESGGKPDDFVRELKAFGRRYPHAGYGGSFKRWMYDDDDNVTNDSYGNGGAMRVSPVVMFTKTLDETEHFAALSASNTHLHPEGIKGAAAIAAACFLAKEKKDRAEIRHYIETRFGYNLSERLDDIRPNYPDYSVPGTRSLQASHSVPTAIIAFLESHSFEDAIRNAVSLGGDSDTQADMAGAIAEYYYGIPDYIMEQAFQYLDDYLLRIANEAKNHCFEIV